VDRLETLLAIDILNSVKNNSFNPQEVAFLSEDTLSVDKPDSTTYVNIEKYDDDKISLKARASGKNFLFLGDNYVPVGWKATIDGNETKIFKVNHGFRGIVVPEGEHSIEFVFEPASWVLSKNIALALSSLTILGLILGVFVERNKSRKSLN
jgi:uncharacterized membrane protein YfhO